MARKLETINAEIQRLEHRMERAKAQQHEIEKGQQRQLHAYLGRALHAALKGNLADEAGRVATALLAAVTDPAERARYGLPPLAVASGATTPEQAPTKTHDSGLRNQRQERGFVEEV